MVNFGGPESGQGVANRRCQSVQMQSDALASSSSTVVSKRSRRESAAALSSA